MKTLSKLKLNAIKKNDEFILNRERMKEIKGGSGRCNIYCDSALAIYNASSCHIGYTCLGAAYQRCECSS